MASKLNSPADFLTSKPPAFPVPDTTKMDLLPPSAFESLSGDDAWKELARATNEVMALKLENQRLKDEQNVSRFTTHQDFQRKDDKTEDRKYIDELITKQASEIGELKTEMQTIKCKHKEEILEIEKQYTYQERQLSQTIASLEAEMKAQEDRYDSQVNRLSHEHQLESENLKEVVQKLRDELSLTLSQSKTQINELEAKLKDTEEKLLSTVQELQYELKSKDIVIENQNKQISKMKNYIGDSEKTPKPVEVWRKEKDTLENKLQISHLNEENLQSNLQLLNIRLASMKEILTLQETELSRANQDKIDKSKQEQLLLTRWREKVYALLVQQKSSDIVKKKDEQNWNEKVLDLQNRIASANNQVEVLTHSLSDRQAQLDIEANNNKKLQQELMQAQHVALNLDDRLTENIQTVQNLQQFTENIGARFQGNFDVLHSILGSLRAYGQRISFASSRMEVLQGLFARKNAMTHLQSGKEKEVTETGNQLQLSGQDTANSMSHIAAELEMVTKERDRLTKQLREDSESWNERLQAATVKCQEENKTLRITLEDLELSMQEKSQKCDQLEEEVERLQSDLDESNEEVELMKIELGKQQVNIDQVLEEQKTVIEAQFVEQMSEYDRKISDAKREQAKAVVSLRQLERQTARDKERASEHLTTMENHYVTQLTAIQEQLRSVEKERNMMMATLRQEGLLGKVRSERSEPVKLGEEDLDVSPPQAAPDIKLSPRVHFEDETKDEPITAVLEDLKSLTSAVLKDDVSSSDSDDGQC